MLEKANVYFSGTYASVRADGRKEACGVSIMGRNGYGFAYYCIDGEEPVLTDEVWLEADMYHLPYADPDDPTVTFKDAVWRFADKEIHFLGKWGGKGYWDHPRLETPGLSHVYGRYYVGDQPYKQMNYHVFNENTSAFDYAAEEQGFTVH